MVEAILLTHECFFSFSSYLNTSNEGESVLSAISSGLENRLKGRKMVIFHKRIVPPVLSTVITDIKIKEVIGEFGNVVHV